jgi:N-acetyl-anhydromuramyl-L-alanine amidase AmpD
MAKRYKDRPPAYERHEVRNKSSRNGSPVYGIMCHTTESSDLPRTDDDLNGVGNWFDNTASQASSWIGVDGDGHSHLWVPGAQKAWTMGHYDVNAQTLNIEFVGRAAQPRSAWEEAQLKVGAKWAAYAIINYDFVKIDPKNVRRSVLRPGPRFVTSGIGRHKDLTDVGIGSHTDPGPEFPMSHFIDLVQYYCKNGWTVKT